VIDILQRHEALLGSRIMETHLNAFEAEINRDAFCHVWAESRSLSLQANQSF